MKRRKLLRHLQNHGCSFLREGRRHTIYENVPRNLVSEIPRHPEIDASLVRKICKDLAVPPPSEK